MKCVALQGVSGMHFYWDTVNIFFNDEILQYIIKREAVKKMMKSLILLLPCEVPCWDHF